MRETLHAQKRGQQRGFTLLSNLVIDAFGIDWYDGRSQHFQCLNDHHVRRHLATEVKRLQKQLGRLLKKLESKDPIAHVVSEDGYVITSMNKTARHLRDARW